MDYQILFNIVMTMCGVLAGWVLNNITTTLRLLDADVRAMPTNYVSKEDYRNDIRELKDLTQKIFDKLDGKADK